MSEKRKGRPTAAERIRIKNTLQKYYLQEVDRKTTKSFTRYNIKTINEYFNQWDEENQKFHDDSFLEKAKEQRQKAIMRFRYQISKLDEISAIIEEKIKKSNEPPTKGFAQLVKLWHENEKMITELTLHVTNMRNSPTADVSLATKTDGMLKNYGITLPQ